MLVPEENDEKLVPASRLKRRLFGNCPLSQPDPLGPDWFINPCGNKLNVARDITARKNKTRNFFIWTILSNWLIRLILLVLYYGYNSCRLIIYSDYRSPELYQFSITKILFINVFTRVILPKKHNWGMLYRDSIYNINWIKANGFNSKALLCIAQGFLCP